MLQLVPGCQADASRGDRRRVTVTSLPDKSIQKGDQSGSLILTARGTDVQRCVPFEKRRP